MAGIEIEEDYLRDSIVDLAAGRGVGVNGLNITDCRIAGPSIRLQIASPFAWTRKPVIVFRGAAPEASNRLVVNGAKMGSYHRIAEQSLK